MLENVEQKEQWWRAHILSNLAVIQGLWTELRMISNELCQIRSTHALKILVDKATFIYNAE